MNINTEIIKACMADDRKAIKWLYEQCFHKFMPLCYRYNKNDEDARANSFPFIVKRILPFK